ncbi:hypothetical protein D3H55_09220 [Bacillus salacetis]|uniref:Uncharacterized protein n=1 Tax=Bacillus salacetis TaxID=2315464 RepID=A0A3A1R368_9BACI|nr:hypothetical protein [Bacillus salacetis]RIW34684.1 hypothetical protein D3H55_09220 [Bacillus salacetis]
MPIRGIFTGNSKHDDIPQRIHSLESEVKRINSLDVTMKRFKAIEGRLHSMLNNQTSGVKRSAERKSAHESQDLHKDLLKQVKSMISFEVAQHIRKWDNQYAQLQTLEKEVMFLKEELLREKNRIESITEELVNLKNQTAQPSDSNESQVVYQDITIERMMIDKYEMNNTIPHLGVKNLSGFLNIGATYGKGMIPEDLAEDFLEGMTGFKKRKEEEEEEEVSSDDNQDDQQPDGEEEITEIVIDD